MNHRQLSMVLIGLAACLAGGFLFLLFQVSPNVAVEKRLPSAQTIHGDSLAPNISPAPIQLEPVNIEGSFESFSGSPGNSTSRWARFRGPEASNISASSIPLADHWDADGPPVLWTVKLGEGHAGPTVWDGCVYIMDYDEEKEADALRCFSFQDGQEIWRRWYKAPTKRNHGVSRTVPALTEDYIVTMGPRCHVMCVDRQTGNFRWGLDLVEDYQSTVPLWYTGQCPLIDDATAVIAPAGRALMLGIDCASGQVVWQTPNPQGWKMSHSSIMTMTLLGKRMYVYCALGGIAGVSAEEEDRGQLLWSSTVWNHPVTAPSPLAIDDHRIFLTAGYGGGSMMLKISKTNGSFSAEKLFDLDKTIFACEQQTPIFYQNHLLGILPKDAAELRGQFACLNTDGELVWTSGKTERFGLGPFLVADDKIFILKDNGELTLIKASLQGYEKLARKRVLQGHDAWGPMALVDGKLLLRDSENLMCLDVSAPIPTSE